MAKRNHRWRVKRAVTIANDRKEFAAKLNTAEGKREVFKSARQVVNKNKTLSG